MMITYSHKVIFLGDSCVGKTTIFDKLLYDKNTDAYSATIGVDYGVRIYSMDNDIKIKLKLWDTAGQERFKSIITTYYNSCDVVIFVFDAHRPETFNNIEKWINQYLENYRRPDHITNNIYLDNMTEHNMTVQNVSVHNMLVHDMSKNDHLFFLIENKCDLITETNAIPKHQIDSLVKKYNMHYFKTSAKVLSTSTNGIETVFNQIIQIIYKKYSDIYLNHKNIILGKQNNSNNSDLLCCNIL